MSGLLSALMLRRAGWTVDIYERVESELSGRGAGIVAQQELIERLRKLGLETSALGVHITTRKILDAQGQLTEEIHCPQVLTAWERVYRLLRDAFPPERYDRGRGLVGYEPGAISVLARFSDGETIEADLLVGADGTRSTVRQQALPSAVPLYAGYCAWRAMIAESAIPRDTHRDLFEYMTFTLPPGEQLLGYPVAGPDNDLRTGHRRYNVVWYRPADEKTKLQWLLTDERGTTHAISIPAAADPPRSDRGNACRCRAAGGAAIPPDRATDRGADLAADLRPRIAAHGVRPRGDPRRCGVRGAPARGRRRLPRRRTPPPRWWRRLRPSPPCRRRSSATRRRGCARTPLSSSARAISAPICRRRKRRKSGRAPGCTAPPAR
jgi:2-polyprenyl-6-methoxyphenol hydroxylase-like FAD-dependent oxidoreductase